MLLSSHLRLRTKALVVPGVLAVVSIVLTWQAITRYRTALFQDRALTIAADTRSTVSLLTYFADAERRSELSPQAARRQARAILASYQHGSDNFTVALDQNGVFQAHPNPALIGLPRSELPSHVQTSSARVLQDLNTRGETLSRVLVPQETGGKARLKLTYAVRFEPWHWAVGTAVYVDDIDSAVRTYALRLGAISLAVILVASCLGWLLFHEFDRSLRSVIAGMARMARGELPGPISGGKRRDEAGQLARMTEIIGSHLADAGRLDTSHQAHNDPAAPDRQHFIERVVDAFKG